MSVLRELIFVIITATTQLEATIAAAVQATDFTMMAPHVKVSRCQTDIYRYYSVNFMDDIVHSCRY